MEGKQNYEMGVTGAKTVMQVDERARALVGETRARPRINCSCYTAVPRSYVITKYASGSVSDFIDQRMTKSMAAAASASSTGLPELRTQTVTRPPRLVADGVHANVRDEVQPVMGTQASPL